MGAGLEGGRKKSLSLHARFSLKRDNQYLKLTDWRTVLLNSLQLFALCNTKSEQGLPVDDYMKVDENHEQGNKSCS